jgi:hypothetical protein
MVQFTNQPRGVDARMGVIDQTPTLQLGKAGIDNLSNAKLAKANRDRAKFAKIQERQKLSQDAQATVLGQLEANQGLESYLENDESELGLAYDRFKDGKANDRDNLMLAGVTNSYILEKQNASARGLQDAQADALLQGIQNEKASGEATAMSFKAVYDEKTGEKTGEIEYDPSVGMAYLQANNPSAIQTFQTNNLTLEANKAKIDLAKQKSAIEYTLAQAKLLEAQTKQSTAVIDKINLGASGTANKNAQDRYDAGDRMSVAEFQSDFFASGGTDISKLDVKGAQESGLITDKGDAEDKREIEQAERDENTRTTSMLGQDMRFLLNSNRKVQSIIDNLDDDFNLGNLGALGGGIISGMGNTGILSMIPTFGVQIKSDLMVIQSKEALGYLMEMKENSENGASGLGQVSNVEIGLLMSQSQGLQNRQLGSRAELKQAVTDYRYLSNRIMYAKYEEYKRKYKLTDEQAIDTLGIAPNTMNLVEDSLKKFEEDYPTKAYDYGGGYITLKKNPTNYLEPEPTPEPEPAPTPTPPNPAGSKYTVTSVNGQPQ